MPPEQWQLPEQLAWPESEVERLLDAAQGALLGEAQRLRMPVALVRKPRACGVVPLPGRGTIYEALEGARRRAVRGPQPQPPARPLPPRSPRGPRCPPPPPPQSWL